VKGEGGERRKGGKGGWSIRVVGDSCQDSLTDSFDCLSLDFQDR